MLGKKLVLACLVILASIWITGCMAKGTATIGFSSGVVVTPSATTVDGTDTITLTATVFNDKSSSGVTWTLSGAGALSNKTTTGATYTAPAATSSSQSVTITATSVANSSSSTSVQITIPAKPAIITTGSSLNSSVGATYNVTLQATGGIPPYTWALTGGALPSCVTLNTSTGAITGAITSACAGNFSPTFTVTDSGTPNKLSASAQLNFTITVPALTLPATITPATATAGVAYAGSVAASGGISPLTYSITSGALPTGLTLNTSTGAITGTATVAGTANFTIKVVDNFGSTPATQAYNLTVNPGAATHFAVAATSSTTIIAGGTVSFSVTALDAYNNTATGYSGAVKFTSTDTIAVLPANATLVNGAGSFSATLKTAGSQTVTATDTVNSSITGSTGAITVNPAATAKLIVSAPSTATNNVAFNFTVTSQDQYNNTTTGYTGTVHFTSTDSSAVLPANASLSNGTGSFSATLKTDGTQTITATDTVTSSITGTSGSINISTPLTINTATLPSGNVGASYSQTLSASGGTGTGYTWTATNSTLASYGLSLSTSGQVSSSGPLTQAGTATFTANVKDSGNNTAQRTFTIQIYSAISLPPANSLPNGYVGIAYAGTISGSGGSTGQAISITSALAPSNGTLAAVASGNSVNISGTPATATTESITVKLTDTTTGTFITQTYTFTITSPTAPSLPSSALTATVNQSYTATVTVTGGVGPSFNWTINGSSLATDGSLVSIGDGLSVSNNGSSVLSISGTPTSIATSPGVQFTAQVKDNTTSLSSGVTTYTIVVNSAASSQVNGSIKLNNICGSFGFTPPAFDIAISTSPVQHIQSSTVDGSFSFASIPNGTYTITPSYSGPSGSAAVFYPASQSITVTNGSAVVPNFNAALAYTVSGSVSYSGPHSGQIYVILVNNYCSGYVGSGTSITTAGSFTVRGVAPGSYTVYAVMDPVDLGLGQGATNTYDPIGTSSITVNTNNVTGASVTVANNDPTGAPTQIPTLNAIYGTHTGVTVSYSPAVGSSGEVATSYDLAWSTSPALSGNSLASVAGSYNYKAVGYGTIWILNNGITGSSSFSDGATYYFQARARNSSGAGPWVVYGGTTPTGITVNPPSGTYTVSGNVTIPAGVTVAANAKLYVGVYSTIYGIYATILSSPAVGSNNPFTLSVPSTSTNSWQFFTILDQNNDGEIDIGDVTNTHGSQGGPPTVTISSSGTRNVTLPNFGAVTTVQTYYTNAITSSGAFTDYALNISGGQGTKLPVSMTLTAASKPNVLIPMDISNYCPSCGSGAFQIYQDISGGTPAVGDTYTFTVNYSDGTSDTNVTATVTGWDGSSTTVAGPSTVATNLSPTGTSSTNTQPTFAWTYPAGASTAGDHYQFRICCDTGGGDIWNVPGSSANSNGFTYLEIPGASIAWGVDPTGGSNTPSVSNLTTGTSYTWSISAFDSNGNWSSAQTWYKP